MTWASLARAGARERVRDRAAVEELRSAHSGLHDVFERLEKAAGSLPPFEGGAVRQLRDEVGMALRRLRNVCVYVAVRPDGD